ncbi:hypothetical protein C8A03DRAFT_37792 [Achaetomium macrosporum]|uniref:Uncharacterized protein n=1 Tax=Achaetomium macrosporum TaxID=79813 RepID=A0AAN7C3Q2_9PEZI|nr:hypothetical protein C8A03DRAFT_37792 [Achaetomium macrosporum]
MLLAFSCWRVSRLLVILLLFSLSRGAQERMPRSGPSSADDSQSWLYDVISPETVETIAADTRLRSTYLAVVGVCADTARRLAQRYQVSQLATVSDDLESHLRKLSTSMDVPDRTDLSRRSPVQDGADGVDKRGLLSGITDALGNLVSGAAGNLLKGIGGIADNALPSAGFFAGVGIGQGAAQGLNLTSAGMSKTIAAKVAQENNMTASGLNPTLQNAAMGLTATALKAVMDAGSALNLTSLVSGLNISGAAMELGSGLGTGASLGLNISSAASPPPQPAAQSSGLDLPGIANNFALGLSRSFTQNIHISLPSGQMAAQLLQMVGPAAAGFGRGLGSGAAVGLGLQQGQPVPTTQAGGGLDVAGVSQVFAEGLTSSFLANGTVSRLTDSLGKQGGGMLPNVDIARAANGFARGLLTGVSDGVEAMGGVDALLNGKATVPAGAIPETNVAFNDSIGGAAVGLGQGLGTSGAITVQKLFAAKPAPTAQKRSVSAVRLVAHRSALAPRQGNTSSILDGVNLSQTLTADAISTIAQKGVDVLTCDGVAGIGLVARGLMESGVITLGGMDPKTTSFLTGLVPKGRIHIVNGKNTYDIDAADAVNASSILAAANNASVNNTKVIPFAVLLILHIGIAIGGLAVVFPMVVALRSLRSLLERMKMAHLLPPWTPKLTKVLWLGGIGPSVVLVLIFGVLVTPSSAHFQTAHGILGLLVVIVSLATVPLYVLSTPTAGLQAAGHDIPPITRRIHRLSIASHMVNNLLLILIAPAMFTGVSDLITLTLCLIQVVITFQTALTLVAGIAATIGFVFLGGQLASGADIFLLYRASKGAKGKGTERGDEERLPRVQAEKAGTDGRREAGTEGRSLMT